MLIRLTNLFFFLIKVNFLKSILVIFSSKLILFKAMKDIMGEKIRKIRQLKGFSQSYMASRLKISQRTYSKIEHNEIKIDLMRINEIAKIFNIDQIALMNFDDSLFFLDKMEKKDDINVLLNELQQQYEKRIKELNEEVVFLRRQLELKMNTQNE